MNIRPILPALLTRISNLSSVLLNSWAKWRMESKLARFSFIKITSSFPVLIRMSFSASRPRTASRQARMTRAPRRARSRAVSLPIPVLAPEFIMKWKKIRDYFTKTLKNMYTNSN